MGVPCRSIRDATDTSQDQRSIDANLAGCLWVYIAAFSRFRSSIHSSNSSNKKRRNSLEGCYGRAELSRRTRGPVNPFLGDFFRFLEETGPEGATLNLQTPSVSTPAITSNTRVGSEVIDAIFPRRDLTNSRHSHGRPRWNSRPVRRTRRPRKPRCSVRRQASCHPTRHRRFWFASA